VPWNVERIYHAIQDLSDGELKELFALLHRGYKFRLSDDRAKFKRPWNDPKNGFGEGQARLLDFLDKAGGAVETREIVQHLWGRELDPLKPYSSGSIKLGDESAWQRKCDTLRGRLRQLKKSTNDRLDKHGWRWWIDRPRNGYLELAVSAADAERVRVNAQ
jgi:hypothetical protein